MKVRTALPSHHRLLIPQSLHLLTLLLHLLLCLLLPPAAEAVQTAEAGAGEGHGLSTPHRVHVDLRKGEGGEEKRGGVRTVPPSSHTPLVSSRAF